MRPAELLTKSVVASAAANCSLRADSGGDKLKHGSCVVVKTAHYGGVDPVGNIHGVEILFKALKVCPAIITEVFEHSRRTLRNLTAHRTFTIEYSHRVAFKSAKTCFTKLVPVSLKILTQSLLILSSAGRTAYRIYLEPQIRNPEKSEYLICKRNNLGIHSRTLCAEARSLPA